MQPAGVGMRLLIVPPPLFLHLAAMPTDSETSSRQLSPCDREGVRLATGCTEVHLAEGRTRQELEAERQRIALESKAALLTLRRNVDQHLAVKELRLSLLTVVADAVHPIVDG